MTHPQRRISVGWVWKGAGERSVIIDFKNFFGADDPESGAGKRDQSAAALFTLTPEARTTAFLWPPLHYECKRWCELVTLQPLIPPADGARLVCAAAARPATNKARAILK